MAVGSRQVKAETFPFDHWPWSGKTGENRKWHLRVDMLVDHVRIFKALSPCSPRTPWKRWG